MLEVSSKMHFLGCSIDSWRKKICIFSASTWTCYLLQATTQETKPLADVVQELPLSIQED